MRTLTSLSDLQCASVNHYLNAIYNHDFRRVHNNINTAHNDHRLFDRDFHLRDHRPWLCPAYDSLRNNHGNEQVFRSSAFCVPGSFAGAQLTISV
jgi:hypothetical protein